MAERPINPSNVDVTRAWIEEYIGQLHTCFPARVESYDETKQVADVTPLIKYPFDQPDGSIVYEDLPILSTCPVVFPRNSGWFIAFGLDVGDTVLVVVQELSIAAWRTAASEDIAPPGDLRRHHLANAVVIPGLFRAAKALAHAPAKPSDSATPPDAPALVIGSDAADGPRITFKLNGEVAIECGATANVVVNGGSASVARVGDHVDGGTLTLIVGGTATLGGTYTNADGLPTPVVSGSPIPFTRAFKVSEGADKLKA